VNVDELRTLGLEGVATWRPRPGLDLSLHHAILQARRRVDGAYAGPAEDRPDFLTTFAATWRRSAGPLLRVETVVLGPRHSADATDGDDGLRRLPADAELSCRIDNVFDQRVDAQTGLPEAGRTFLAGLSLWYTRDVR
jgi:outer membrane receptor protein involved in Fe transport